MGSRELAGVQVAPHPLEGAAEEEPGACAAAAAVAERFSLSLPGTTDWNDAPGEAILTSYKRRCRVSDGKSTRRWGSAQRRLEMIDTTQGMSYKISEVHKQKAKRVHVHRGDQ